MAGWETCFVAVTVLVGGTVDDAVTALGPDGATRAAELTNKLADPRRGARAQALATAAQEVAVALDEVTLR